MKKFLTFALSCFLFTASVVPAQGALNLLFQAPDVTKLQDNDWDVIASGDAILSVGDILIGMYEIESFVNNTTNAVNAVTTSTFTGVFAQAVDTTGAGGIFAGGVSTTFRPLTAAEYTAIQVLFPAMPNRVSNDTILFVYDDAGSPGNFVDPTNAGNVNAGLATAVNGTPLFEIGFRDGDEFFRADADTANLPATSQLLFKAWMNVTHKYAAGTGVAFFDHQTVSAFGSNDPLTAILSEYQLSGGLEQGGNPGDFQIPTDTDGFVLVASVPEPASMLIWGGMSLVGACAAYRRRRKLAA
jgi:hypothetical protein